MGVAANRRPKLYTMWCALVGAAVIVLWVIGRATPSERRRQVRLHDVQPTARPESVTPRALSDVDRARARASFSQAQRGGAVQRAAAVTSVSGYGVAASDGGKKELAHTQAEADQADADAGAGYASDAGRGESKRRSAAGIASEGAAPYIGTASRNDIVSEGGTDVDPWSYIPAARTHDAPAKPVLTEGVHYVADYDVSAVAPPPRPAAAASAAFEYVPPDSPFAHVWVSEAPRVLLAPHFATDEETDELIRVGLASGRVQRNAHLPTEGATFTVADFLSPIKPPGKKYVDRILDFLGFRGRNKVPQKLQLLHYPPGTSSTHHRDYSDPAALGSSDPAHRKQNTAVTTVLYLATTDVGGETCFPMANGKTGPIEKIVTNNTDCSHGLRVKPTKGTLVVFYDMKPDLTVDPFSKHISCHVRKGEKWAAPLFIHTFV